MAYINQDDDERFRPLAGLGAPGVAAPMGTPAVGPTAVPRAPQAPQKSSFVNLQHWLGLNQGAGDNMAGALEGRFTQNVSDEVNRSAQPIEADHLKAWQDRIAQNEKTASDAINAPRAPLTLQNHTPGGYLDEAITGGVAATQRDSERLRGVGSGLNYDGLAGSAAESSQFDALRGRLGLQIGQGVKNVSTLAGRQTQLQNQGISGNKYNAAAVGASSRFGNLGNAAATAANNAFNNVRDRSAQSTANLDAQNSLQAQRKRLEEAADQVGRERSDEMFGLESRVYGAHPGINTGRNGRIGYW